MKKANPTKQTRQKIEKENKKQTKIKECRIELVEQDIKKNFDYFIKGSKISEKKCEG